MRREIARASERVAVSRRYVASPRHTMQVDFAPFLHRLRRLRDRGERLARRRGNSLPVPSRARQENWLGANFSGATEVKMAPSHFPGPTHELGPARAIHPRACRGACRDRRLWSRQQRDLRGMARRLRLGAFDRAWHQPRAVPQLNRGMAVWRTQINYIGAALEGDVIDVATWPVLNDKRLRIDRRFQIRRKATGETLLRALIHYVCIDLHTRESKANAAGIHAIRGRARSDGGDRQRDPTLCARGRNTLTHGCSTPWHGE